MTERDQEPKQEQEQKNRSDGQKILDDGKQVLEDSKKMFIDSRQIVAENLKYYMKKMQVTSVEVCKDLGIRVSTFSDWLNQKSFPRIEKLDALADYFGIKKSDLIEVHPEPADTNAKAAAAMAEAAVGGDAEELAQAVSLAYEAYLQQKNAPDLARPQQAAYAFLLAQDETTLPLDLRALRYERKIVFESFEDYERMSGVRFHLPALPAALRIEIAAHAVQLLLYRQELRAAERNWALAQELAPLLLGLTKTAEHDEKQCQEISLCAMELLLPTPLVAALADKGVAVEQGVLRDIFQVTDEAAALCCHNWPRLRQAAQDQAQAEQLRDQYAAWMALVCMR